MKKQEQASKPRWRTWARHWPGGKGVPADRIVAAAYTMLGVLSCERKRWTGAACADLPGSPGLCAVCLFCQVSGLPVPTREDLERYYRRHR